jgi:transcriptional regulator with XRE-family HTH domain
MSLTRADLAARMGASPGRVSQILGGGENLTLRTLAALSTTLDGRFDLQLGTLKADDAYSSRDTADVEAAPAENHHSLSRPGISRAPAPAKAAAAAEPTSVRSRALDGFQRRLVLDRCDWPPAVSMRLMTVPDDSSAPVPTQPDDPMDAQFG